MTHPVDLYLNSLKPTSKVTMHYVATRLVELLFGHPVKERDLPKLNWGELTEASVVSCMDVLRNEYASSTGNLYISCLRGLLKAAYALQAFTPVQYKSLFARAGYLSVVTYPGRVVSPEEYQRLLGVGPSNTMYPFLHIRDRMVLSIFYETGIRQRDFTALLREDVFPIGGGCVCLSICEADGNYRDVDLSLETSQYILDWIEKMHIQPGESLPMRMKKYNRTRRRAMSEQDIHYRFKALSDLAGVSPHVTSMDFAKTYRVRKEAEKA